MKIFNGIREKNFQISNSIFPLIYLLFWLAFYKAKIKVYSLVWMPCFYIYFCSVLDFVAHFPLLLVFEKYEETENSLSQFPISSLML